MNHLSFILERASGNPMSLLRVKKLEYLDIFISSFFCVMDLFKTDSSEEESHFFKHYVLKDYLGVENTESLRAIITRNDNESATWEHYIRDVVEPALQKLSLVAAKTEHVRKFDTHLVKGFFHAVFQKPWMYCGCFGEIAILTYIDGILLADERLSSNNPIRKHLEAIVERTTKLRWENGRIQFTRPAEIDFTAWYMEIGASELIRVADETEPEESK